ncbi:class I SAM-dependent methyltransferase [Methanolobus vulcani]|jgi:ubiquinone/menaquinone biosynthesis C-methylase UbiE|uniref:Class I SAM-dependent methyltransferase n=1 Tax=Methanolobus vulcani TaxID=38026 RepID=A0A7Z8P1M5_9EURY|nr:class I SAM-dependent methyltransferase [Methanolobus vulcani]TQD26333.1 class I SAM-dependent methyltransferase [Methanolobus vulcani]
METKEIIQNYWDYRSETYNTSFADQSEEERRLLTNMLSTAMDNRTDLKVLDVGTGPGVLALIAAELDNNVTAVDLSEKMIEKARENALMRSLDIEFMQGDAEKLELPDAHFDVVMNKYLLWTLPEPTKALTEWKRVLKDGGTIIAIDGDWHNEGLISRTIKCISNAIKMLKKVNYQRVYNKHYDPLKNDLPLFSLKPERVIQHFKEAGFENVSIERMDNLFSSSGKSRKLLDIINCSSPVYVIKAQK